MGQHNFSEMLTAIKEFKMTPEEEMAYRVSIMYLRLAHHYFPSHMHERYGRGDPRKNNLFRYCMKLVRETNGLLAKSDYNKYLTAQFQMLKSIDGTPLISVGSIVGDKAWTRWKMWERKFNVVAQAPVVEAASEQILGSDDLFFSIRRRMARSHQFVLRRCGDIKEAVADGRMARWVQTGAVDPVYASLHPACAGVDLGVQSVKVDERVKVAFQEIITS